MIFEDTHRRGLRAERLENLVSRVVGLVFEFADRNEFFNNSTFAPFGAPATAFFRALAALFQIFRGSCAAIEYIFYDFEMAHYICLYCHLNLSLLSLGFSLTFYGDKLCAVSLLILCKSFCLSLLVLNFYVCLHAIIDNVLLFYKQTLFQRIYLLIKHAVVLRYYFDCLDKTGLLGGRLLRFKHHCLQGLLVQLKIHFQVFILSELCVHSHMQALYTFIESLSLSRCTVCLFVNISLAAFLIRWVGVKFAN